MATEDPKDELAEPKRLSSRTQELRDRLTRIRRTTVVFIALCVRPGPAGCTTCWRRR
jgi:hypothetical protein